MCVIVDDAAFLDEIVIGDVGAHPGLHHHRRRDLDHPLHVRQIVPHFAADAQRCDAGFLGRRQDADEGARRAVHPDAQTERALPARRGDGHLELALHGLRPQQVLRPIEDLASAGFICGECRTDRQHAKSKHNTGEREAQPAHIRCPRVDKLGDVLNCDPFPQHRFPGTEDNALTLSESGRMSCMQFHVIPVHIFFTAHLFRYTHAHHADQYVQQNQNSNYF